MKDFQDISAIRIRDVCPWVRDHVAQVSTQPHVENARLAPYVTPRADVKEASVNYEVVIEMPGCSKDHITIDLADDCLTVSGDCRGIVTRNTDTDDTVFLKRERPSSLMKQLCFPASLCDTAKATSYLRNGLLTITIPKRASRSLVIEESKSNLPVSVSPSSSKTF